MEKKVKKKTRKTTYTIIISVVLAIVLITAAYTTDFLFRLNYKIYDLMVKCDYRLFHKRVTGDCALVAIDNKTLITMPERWPYSRSKFAAVIDNLKQAGAKVIALDFIFYGASTPAEDERLKKSIEEAGNVILGAVIDEEGRIHVSSEVVGSHERGIVTKFQCADGIVRKCITYMVQQGEESVGMVSWGLKILEMAKGVDLATLSDKGDRISLSSVSGGEWTIPVEKDNKSFMVHFRSHTKDFVILSFVDVLNNNFDPARVKDKIVLLGMASTILGDIHNTPIGWIPGLTLNADSFLTIYNRDFLRRVPHLIEIALTILGVIFTAWAVSVLGPRKALLAAGVQILLYMTISLVLLACGFVWDYSIFAVAVSTCPFIGRKLRIEIQTKKYWT